jgi:Protein of unknown function (DUF2380)
MRHSFFFLTTTGFSAWRRNSDFIIVFLLLVLATLCSPALAGESASPLKIAVFDFELDDHSAGGGIIPEDDIDRANLKQSTDEAKRLLLAGGRYSIVETSSVVGEVKASGGVIDCNSCEVGLARKLGADQALIGVITRVNRTEYTLFMRVKDARSGSDIANGFTGLRMGANYAWSRGVTWLMNNQLQSKLASALTRK